MPSDLRLSKLLILPELQMRVELDSTFISELRELWQDNPKKMRAELPAIIVFRDKEGNQFVADGFHRCKLYELEGVDLVKAEVIQGEKRDALFYAIGANKKRGVKRNHGDRRKIVLAMLNDPEWSTWSQGRIAEHCGVTQQYVSSIQAQLSQQVHNSSDPDVGHNSSGASTEKRVTGKDGKSYPVVTSKSQFTYKRVMRMIAELKGLLAALSPIERAEVQAALRSLGDDTDSSTLAV